MNEDDIKPEPARSCACPAGKCQPEKNVGSHCWRSGCPILASDFPDAVGADGG